MLDTLSSQELLIFTYCLLKNRITFFVKYGEQNLFWDAVNTLEIKGYFKPLPINSLGCPYFITEEKWTLIEEFREDILARTKVAFPDLENKLEFFDSYQGSLGYGDYRNRQEDHQQ